MPVRIIEERTGLPDQATADLIADFLRRDGWTVTVRPEGGTFTLVAERIADPAENTGLLEGNFDPGDEPDPAPGIDGLLNFVAFFESGGNYNAYYGQGGNQNNPKFTSKTIANVREWQQKFVANGSRSSAVGKYQIIRKTLDGLVASLGLDAENTRFTQDTQDAMGRALAEGRGFSSFADGSMSIEDFGENIAKEWAAMPVLQDTTRPDGAGGTVQIRAGQSYYDGVGTNSALTTVAKFRAALEASRTT